MSAPATELKFPDHWKTLPQAAPKVEEVGLPAAAPDVKTRILIADDDRMCRELLAFRLDQAGYQVIVTRDGEGALEELRKPDAPPVAILDWLMPGADGPSICQRMRSVNKSVYLILLTARDRKEDVVEGLDSGADDYLVKPFETGELLSRVKVGLRIINMQRELTARISNLESPGGKGSEPRGLTLL